MALYDRADPMDDEVLTAARIEARRKVERSIADEALRARLEAFNEEAFENWDDPEWRRSMADALAETIYRGVEPAVPTPPAGFSGVGTGYLIYSRTRPRLGGTDELTGLPENPIGGVVVEIVDDYGEDGDFVRSFRVRFPFTDRDHLRQWVIAEADVNLDVVEPPTTRVRSLVRAMAARTAAGKGLWTPDQTQMVTDMQYLQAAL